ncbi:phosphatase PAP2 family protein [Mycobacterium sp. CBMA293]|uniref:phosphatase PAP2 family protein n=2 Tax=Mycolicibacterium TaxID=1866885 RepID=UPI0012DCC319|nr:MULTISPECIES: phosphatase PAP2 family protein [unclassified Mycolicibacterium]MUL49720.1 phosphatase PAP2 family protein [Mycolicibacterium sp. CBMA 360]MUL62632.1 phosphatase PAP2 family protein [Mycolicibacterium sp. CBMA 335]MUL72549.1 phosphatase PAP2 family protein [Mycolicibacterium sp. CBMA 311]MUL95050.1 phosphatase PAP2 family protein [Mycolicibacterium sp. CBMA 230]MUM04092.1 UDP-diphosphatase [Mycolicibacterium sp. CBMA 213]
MNLNTQIFYDINDFARNTPWLQPVVYGYATYGVVLFAILLLAGWWLARRTADTAAMAAAVWAPLGVLAAVAINQPIADSINSARPCNELLHIVVMHCNTDGGLPSDHAMMAGAVAAGVWLVNRRLGIVAAVAAIVMAFARVYVAAHYPLDVLVGLVLGAVISVVGYLLARPLLNRLLAMVAQTPLRVLITAAP